MVPFEMLYGHRCRTPLFWNETGKWKVFRLDILQEVEKFVWLGRTFVSRNRDKRATPTIGDGN
jgi:hypothetical protein